MRHPIALLSAAALVGPAPSGAAEPPPAPVAAGEGIALGPDGRPVEVQDYEIAGLLIADAQLMLNVSKALAAHDVVTELFARSGGRAGCAAYNRALDSAVAANVDEWRRTFVAAARATIPIETFKAARSAGVAKADAMLDPYRGALLARVGAAAQPIARRTFAAAGTALAGTVRAAPEPSAAARSANLAQLETLRARPIRFCVVPPD
ncbi:MAG TPA: hypothetical protein VF718_00100 [Allosphingosinicella sp.]|jgi:hypothetical protein